MQLLIDILFALCTRLKTDRDLKLGKRYHLGSEKDATLHFSIFYRLLRPSGQFIIGVDE
jgi:hypothetical protein